MEAVDFSKLLDAGSFEKLLGSRAALRTEMYRGGDGVHFRSDNGSGELIQDVVRLADGAFLFSSNHSRPGQSLHRQIVRDTDWIHIQFRLNGGGSEQLSEDQAFETPEKSCVVARYKKNSIVERTVASSDTWKVVCLLISPAGLTKFMDVSADALPASSAWLTRRDGVGSHCSVFPLRSSMMLAVNDILGCSLQGATRRVFMRGKSLELLATVIREMDGAATPAKASTIKLSPGDYSRLASARTIMTSDLDRPQTLAQLARRVGINRTKLALGFKQVFGVSVHAYWRDVRLSRARELLREPGARVTEVALSMGYSEPSSFTRAFTHKFGVLPRDCRNDPPTDVHELVSRLPS